MQLGKTFLSLASLAAVSLAETHYFNWTVSQITRNVDGLYDSPDVLACNGEYPWPDIRISKGDRVVIDLYNSLEDHDSSIHFHGLFQNTTNQMDGVPGLTQCQVPPGGHFVYNFTVPDQVGSFWYHSHTKGQYMDGMRGAFIIEDPDGPYNDQFEDERTIALAEWYHDNITVLTADFLNVYNPTGAEPIPQNLLFNHYMNGTIDVKPDTDYLFRIINMGGFVSQYFWIEDHEMTVIAVDGIYVEPNITDMIYITVAQRYDVLVHTKNSTDQNFAIMQKFDDTMLDVLPSDLMLNVTNNLQYNHDLDWPEESYVDELDFLDDFYLQPYEDYEVFDHYDHQVTIDVKMDNLGNGINYAFFNNLTYVSPKVPTLGSVLSANSSEVALSQEIYGSNTHSIVLQKDEIVEIVLNNLDTGTHPFHLHGHVFQTFVRGPDYPDTEFTPVAYNESAPQDYPEHPMIRDTLYVRPQSNFVVRFKANNPGVWFFHCHIEWHLLQGLALTFVEDPVGIREKEISLSDTWKQTCAAADGYVGNAAGNTEDFFNLAGESVQPKDLPAGFTARGIVALVFSCIAGVLGCIAIGIYGMADIPNADSPEALTLMEQELIEKDDIDQGLIGESGDTIEEETGSSERYSDDNQGKRYSDDINTESHELPKN